MNHPEFHFPVLPPPLLDDDDSPSAIDEAYINGVCAGLSFRSLLTYGSFEPEAAETQNPLKMPKTEPLPAIADAFTAGSYLPYNFFSDAAAASSASSSVHLPSLLSLEVPPNADSTIHNPTAETVKTQRRRQQHRLSDKTRSLQKLLPWDEKMDMATVLEEAYKYIRFLQAQVSVLQSMPCESTSGAATCAVGSGDLGRLNRQQLLQVVVNSPVAQSQLYSKGCCTYSIEQLVMLKKNAERKQALYQQMLQVGSSNFNPNPNPNL